MTTTLERVWTTEGRPNLMGGAGYRAPQGPWWDEPDKVQWVDPATDLDCLAVRGPAGAWCGYVGVPPSHPWHGLGYSECPKCSGGASWCEHSPDASMDVHGGLTYAAACQEGAQEDRGICHVPAPGRPAEVWWFGFDCAHAGDLSPKTAGLFPPIGEETYRTLAYVRAEVARLAEQLAAVSRG